MFKKDIVFFCYSSIHLVNKSKLVDSCITHINLYQPCTIMGQQRYRGWVVRNNSPHSHMQQTVSCSTSEWVVISTVYYRTCKSRSCNHCAWATATKHCVCRNSW